MHIPEGFIDLPTSVGVAAVAGGSVWASMKAASSERKDRLGSVRRPHCGVRIRPADAQLPRRRRYDRSSAGGRPRRRSLGPWLGIVAVTVVVVIQALLFADGGLVAMGLNVFNMTP